jgi:MFS family permease
MAQALAPLNMRSTSAALCNMGLGLGGALGPWITGLLSDALHPTLGSRSLGPALIAAAVVQFSGALLLLRVARTVRPALDSRAQVLA